MGAKRLNITIIVRCCRQRDKTVDVASQLNAACGPGGKELINLVVVGHVDAGKSTLTGHLLYNQVRYFIWCRDRYTFTL